MKYLTLALALFLAGCASNSNQKTTTPLIGFAKNEYNIYHIIVANEKDISFATNCVKGLRFSAIKDDAVSENKMMFGKGATMIAVDNQFLVGHDIGNATSNEVNSTASIPLSLK